MKSKASLPLSYRLGVASRLLAAVVGGYLLASLSSVCMTLWLALPRADAVVSGMLGSFVFYLLAVIWCFACRNAARAWLGVLAASALLATLAGLAYWMAQS